ncbi:hypothetical protein Q7C36_008542 [Tachysurus vachellii]|uniref:Ig-like domain-containing protein n=1 Tax=Tachysurus vachellii TaxID=175792 RepID=A0AA88N5T5_TACVA|nr:hypothetical protein Q7C36_008542 [Tachysurus vachellii]
MKLLRSSMQLCQTLFLFFSLFDMTQGSSQLVRVVPVENDSIFQHDVYQCITEPEMENPKYSWSRKDWSGLPEGVKAERDFLYFLTSTPDHNGLYICEVTEKKLPGKM